MSCIQNAKAKGLRKAPLRLQTTCTFKITGSGSLNILELSLLDRPPPGSVSFGSMSIELMAICPGLSEGSLPQRVRSLLSVCTPAVSENVIRVTCGSIGLWWSPLFRTAVDGIQGGEEGDSGGDADAGSDG